MGKSEDKNDLGEGSIQQGKPFTDFLERLPPSKGLSCASNESDGLGASGSLILGALEDIELGALGKGTGGLDGLSDRESDIP